MGVITLRSTLKLINVLVIIAIIISTFGTFYYITKTPTKKDDNFQDYNNRTKNTTNQNKTEKLVLTMTIKQKNITDIEPLLLELEIENNENHSIVMNEPSLRNIYFDVEVKCLIIQNHSYFIKNVSSRCDNYFPKEMVVSGNFWSDNQTKTTINKNERINLSTDLKNVEFIVFSSIYYPWVKFREFLYNEVFFMDTIINFSITSYYIPSNNTNQMIVSNKVDVSMVWESPYRRTIRRDAHNENESRALFEAENILDYSRISGLERFNSSWANYIDNLTLEHYNQIFNDLRQKNAKNIVNLTYTGVSEYISNIIKIEWNNDTLTIFNSSKEISNYSYIDPNKNYGWNAIAKICYNESVEDYNITKPVIYGDCYYVSQRLIFYDIFGPLAAYYVDTIQFIIFDIFYNPLFVYILPSFHVVS